MDSIKRTIQLIELWEKILGTDNDWVLFENGTCVICRESRVDINEHTTGILKEWGPLIPGTPLGDFNFEMHENPSGLLVTYYNPDILSFVMDDELKDLGSPLGGALAARYRRGEDAKSLRILHVQVSHSNR